MPEGGCDPVGAHSGAGSSQDSWIFEERNPCCSRFAGKTCDPMGDPCWSSLFLKDCTPWEGPTLEQFMKNCSLWEGAMLEKFVEDCLPWEGHHTGARDEWEEERAAETMCGELTANPIPSPAVLLVGRR